MKQEEYTYNMENRPKANSHNVFFKIPINKKEQNNGQRIQGNNTQKKYENVFDLSNQGKCKLG